MTTAFVMLDYENVQPQDMALLAGGPFKIKIKIFLGATQTRLPLKTVMALQPLGLDVDYVQIDGSGPNAVDFHIAYYVGRLSREHQQATFHIVSKDTGFDPLIKHMRKEGRQCERAESIAEIGAIGGKSPSPRVAAIIENLDKRQAARPRTLKALTATIKAHFLNELSDSDLQTLIRQLVARGYVHISGNKVSYQSAP